MHCGPPLNFLLVEPHITPCHHDTKHVATIPTQPWNLSIQQVDGIQKLQCVPLSPLVYKVKMCEKPHQRLTYAPHSVDGYYIGT